MTEKDAEGTTIDKRLVIGLVLNSSFTLFEFLVGFFIGSLALMSDAGHNLAHTLCLVISLFATKISRIEANEKHTFGFRRTTILAALLNAIILLLLAFYIFYEAIQRLLQPQFVPGLPIIAVAFIGILINGSIAILFRKHTHDLNIKSIFVSTMMNTLGLVGACIGGLLILLTGQPIIDPLMSIFIALLIIYTAWGIISSAVHVLMEGVPEGIDPVKITEAITNVAHVKDIDKLHIWAISSLEAALSCHLTLENCDLQQSTQLVKQIKEELKAHFHIEHATIETEIIAYPPTEEATALSTSHTMPSGQSASLLIVRGPTSAGDHHGSPLRRQRISSWKGMLLCM